MTATLAPAAPRHGVGAVVIRNRLVARRMWLLVASGFAEPVLFLAAMAMGVGALVGSVTVGSGRTVPFAAYVAPALLAASAMNGAVYESTTNTFWKLRYQKVYDAMLASPMSVGGLIAGEIGWAQIRGVAYGVAFLAVTTAAGWTALPWSLLAVPAVVLVGLTFSALGTLVTTFLRTWQDMELVTLVQRAMFLCSATFYPLSVYPPGLREVLRVTPLYQANELLRELCWAEIGPASAGRVGYLVAVAGLAVAVAARRIENALRR
jgi:lipooligosaccharide transport system permease protein